MKDSHNYFARMKCNKLLEMVRPYIAKRNAVMWESISANERLAVTLCYWQQECVSLMYNTQELWENLQSA